MEEIKVITVSLPIVWENKAANLKLCDHIICNIFSKENMDKYEIIPGNTIILLPEMFSCGFTMNHAMAEECLNTNTPLPDKSLSIYWLLETAQRYGCAIMASVPVIDGGEYYNRAYFINPDGSYKQYDKHHLFRMSEEINTYKPGQKRSLFKWNGLRISMNICYDLRFPVWSRIQSPTLTTDNTTCNAGTTNSNKIEDCNNSQYNYDLLLNCANFPKSRTNVLEPLVRARAIENLAYVAFANCSGNSGGIEYCNSSLFSDYKGTLSNCQILMDTPYTEAPVQIIIGRVEPQRLRMFREKFPAYLDSDNYCLYDRQQNSIYF